MTATLLAMLAACGGLFAGIEIPIASLTYEEADQRLEKASQTCSAPIAESLFHTAFPRVGIQVREADAFGNVEMKSGWQPDPEYPSGSHRLLRYVVQVGVPSFDFRKEFALHQREGEIGIDDYQGMESISGEWGIDLPGWREFPVIEYDHAESKPDAFGNTVRVKTNLRLVLPKQVGIVTLVNGDNGNDTQFKVDMSAYTQCVLEQLDLDIDQALVARINSKLGTELGEQKSQPTSGTRLPDGAAAADTPAAPSNETPEMKWGTQPDNTTVDGWTAE